MADDLVVRLILNASQFAAELDKEEAKLKELDAKKIGDKTVHVNVDDAEARARMAEDTKPEEKVIRVREEKEGGGAGGEGLGLAPFLMAGLPALTPLLATATAGVMGLASAFASAAAGAGGLAAVAIPTIKNVIDAANKGAQGMKGLDAAERQAAQQLIQFQKFWQGFTQSFQVPVLNMFTNGLKMLQVLLNDMRPVIQAAAQAFTQLESEAAKALGSPFWRQFFSYLGGTARQSIVTFGEAIGNLIKGFAALLMAFQPLSNQMANGLLHLTQRFAEWATQLRSNQGFQQFIQYVRQNGPLAIQLIGNLASIIGKLIVAMAPLGHQILQVAVQLTSFLNRLLTVHPQLASFIAYAISGIGALKLFGAAISPVVSGIKTLSGIIGAVPKAFQLFATAGRVIGPVLSGIGQGLTVLGGIVRVFASGFVAAIRAVTMALLTNPITAIITLIVGVIAVAAYEIITHWSQVRQFLENTWNAIKSGAETVWNGIKSFLSGVWNGIVSGAHALGQGVVAAFQWMYNHNYYFKDLVDFIRRSWQTAQQVTLSVWNAIKGALTSAWNAIRSAATSVFNAVKSFITSVWNAIHSATSSVWNAISGTVSSVWGRIRSIVDAGANAVRSVLSAAWNAVRSAVSSAWNAVVSTISSAASRIGSVLSNLASQAFSWGRNLINSLVGGIRSMIGSVESAASSVAHAIASFLGFHSPTEKGPGSTADRWMPNLINMLAQGLYNGQGTIGKAASAAVDPITVAIQNAVANSQGQLNRLASATQTAMNRVAHAHTQAARAVAQAQVQHDRALTAMVKGTISGLTSAQDIWNKYLKTVQSAQQTFQKQVQQIQQQTVQQAQSIIQKFQQQLQQTTQEIANFAGGIFGQVNHQQVTAQQLMNNLTDQVNTLRQYNRDMQTLAREGLSKDLLQQLADMGPQAADQIHALASMSRTQLQEYVRLWQEQMNQAQQAAKIKLAPVAQDTEKQLQQLQNTAKQKMGELYNTLRQSLNKAATDTSQQLIKLAQTARQHGENAVANMANAIRSKLPGLTSTAQQWGQALIAAIARGITQNASLVQHAVTNALQVKTTPAVQSMVRGATPVHAAANTSGQTVQYTHNGPLLHVNTLVVQNQQHIQQIQQALYNANQRVLRGLGVRQV